MTMMPMFAYVSRLGVFACGCRLQFFELVTITRFAADLLHTHGRLPLTHLRGNNITMRQGADEAID